MENITIHQDWYTGLVEDLKDIIVEKEFTSRWELVECYHLVGSRILEANDNFERSKIYGKNIVQQVAKSLGKGQRTISDAVAFAKMYPDLNALPDGKNVSWTMIVRKYLPKEQNLLVEVLPDAQVLEDRIKRFSKLLADGAKIQGANIVLKLPRSWE